MVFAYDSHMRLSYATSSPKIRSCIKSDLRPPYDRHKSPLDRRIRTTTNTYDGMGFYCRGTVADNQFSTQILLLHLKF